MNYSDEPNVIRSGKRRVRFLWIGGIVLFVGLVLSVAFFPKFVEFQRRRTPFGPHFGSIYQISFEGMKQTMEIARTEEYDYRPAIYLVPLREAGGWRPEEYSFRMRIEGQPDFEVLPWDPVEGYFGLSRHQIHPFSDVLLELELLRGERVVWKGRRHSFRVGAGHGH